MIEHRTYTTSGTMHRFTDEEALTILKNCGQTFSKQQEQILLTRGAMNVVSCAGSGKTHTLVNLVIKRILTGEIENQSRLLLTTFSKTGAVNMNERLRSLYRQVGATAPYKVEVRTMHSVYLDFLKRLYGENIGRVLSDAERNKYIREAGKIWKKNLSDEEVQSLSTLLSYQINNLVNLKDLHNSHVFSLDMDFQTFSEVHGKFYQLKDADRVIDFDDMQYHVYKLIYQSPPEVVASILPILRRFDSVYVDEFQDTSKMQYEILRALITDKDKCIFIGDDDQCIYEWRGSDPKIMLNIVSYFPEINKMYLDTNYRCKSNILEFANTGVSRINYRENKGMTSANEGGKVEFIYGNANNLAELAKLTADKVESLIANGDKLSDIAILSRNNATATILHGELISRGIITNADSGTQLAKSLYFKDIVAIASLCADTMQGEFDKGLAKQILWKCIQYLGTTNANIISKIMESNGCSLRQAIGYVLNIRGMENEIGKTVNLNGRMRATVANTVRSMSIAVTLDLNNFFNTLLCTNKEEKMTKLMDFYYNGIGFMSQKQSILRLNRGYHVFFTNKLTEMGYDKFIEFLNLAKVYESVDASTLPDAVRISTMHGAKGLEWKNVFIFAYDNFTFPDAAYIVDNVRPEELSDYLDEERRLAYVSATRAIDNLFIVSDNERLSYFCLEQLDIADKALRSIGATDRSADNVCRYLTKTIDTGFRNVPDVHTPKDRLEYAPKTNYCSPKREA